jgi:hypothetical protein
MNELAPLERPGNGLAHTHPPAVVHLPPALYQPETPRPSALAEALAKARDECKAAHHDRYNAHQKFDYASAESVLLAAGAAMDKSGLSLVPMVQEMAALNCGNKAVFTLNRKMLLVHSSGESLPLELKGWPVVEGNGRPLDKAFAIALTSSLAYLYRDLLQMPRVKPEDDLAGRDDSDHGKPPQEAPATNRRKPPPPAQKEPVTVPETDTLSHEEMIRELHEYIESNPSKSWAKAFMHVGVPTPEAWEEPLDADDAVRDVTEGVLPTDKLRSLLRPIKKGA